MSIPVKEDGTFTVAGIEFIKFPAEGDRIPVMAEALIGIRLVAEFRHKHEANTDRSDRDERNDKGCEIMTLEEIKASPKIFLIPADIAPLLGSDPHTIRCTARQRPELLGFEFTFTGNRMKIPRIPFLRFLGVEI